MSYSHTFAYPEYFREFSCKCGDCRATCCHGWGIAVSQDEYFRVMSTDCSPELRRRLDVAFKPASDPAPTPERYALISFNWLGQCPIQTDEGLCMLHRDHGEGAIPEICRRYPRMYRIAPIHECCTSTSCERTLELLFSDGDPVRFTEGEVRVYDEDFDRPACAQMDINEYSRVRKTSFDILSDRSLSVKARIERLACELGATLPYYVIPNDAVCGLYEKLLHTSAALAELDEECKAYYGSDTEVDRFSLNSVAMMDVYVEKMLVNHLFYKGFPRSFKDSTLRQELASVVAVLSLHRYVSEAYLAIHGGSIENFIDVTAKLFRMIEHSRFDEVASRYVINCL